jgi:hypothetical protein
MLLVYHFYVRKLQQLISLTWPICCKKYINKIQCVTPKQRYFTVTRKDTINIAHRTGNIHKHVSLLTPAILFLYSVCKKVLLNYK